MSTIYRVYGLTVVSIYNGKVGENIELLMNDPKHDPYNKP